VLTPGLLMPIRLCLCQHYPEAVAYSGARWTPILVESERVFRLNMNAHSGPKWTLLASLPESAFTLPESVFTVRNRS